MASKYDILMMQRALQLAARGEMYAHPNPMVGAVITDAQGRIIGEGYHRCCGQPHAEVNAVNSVTDKSLLSSATIYVTLEPCSHFGKTPPCADLLVKHRFRRVVVGTTDPFSQVSGRGIARLREGGIDVEVGVLERECRAINAHFFTAHTLRRPFVLLKWAQTADGDINVQASTPTTRALMHRIRAQYDAILVGSGTLLADRPRLDARLCDGPAPRPVILDRRGRCADALTCLAHPQPLWLTDYPSLPEMLAQLYEQHGITSLMVEGGAHILQAFVQQGLWDLIRVEVNPNIPQSPTPLRAPCIDAHCAQEKHIDGNIIKYYSQNIFIDVKNL